MNSPLLLNDCNPICDLNRFVLGQLSVRTDSFDFVKVFRAIIRLWTNYTILSIEFESRNSNANFTVVVETSGESDSRIYRIHYVRSRVPLTVSGGNQIYYGIGDSIGSEHWRKLTRDVAVDLHKGLSFDLLHRRPRGQNSKQHRRRGRNKRRGLSSSQKFGSVRILSVKIHGNVLIRSVSLKTEAHYEQFLKAADWFVGNQDENGAWSIPVTRRLAAGRIQLLPGWYSAMSQGQAISVLVRAYVATGSSKYIDAAFRATGVFHVPSGKGGVRAEFLGRYPWYEEYPTNPGTFVLNGFIYALVGLYDLKLYLDEPDERNAVDALYSAGLDSLKSMIAMFDTGSGTLYDLRHVSSNDLAPNRARWDYHSTHINQLLLLNVTDYDPIFDSTVRRWIGYLKGMKSPQT